MKLVGMTRLGRSCPTLLGKKVSPHVMRHSAAMRLLHAGVRRKDGVFATGVLHLWHAEADRSNLPDNERRLAGVIASGRSRAERGITSLDRDGAAAHPTMAGACG